MARSFYADWNPWHGCTKLKSIAVVISVMLLILSATAAYLSIKNLSGIRPADSYVDRDVHTFSPGQVLPIQVKNTGASGRDRRMNPTRTVYRVYYLDTDGSGDQWSEQALTRELGQKIVDEGVIVARRVLDLPDEHSYITVAPEQTAETYTAGLRRKYTLVLGLSAGYMLLYLFVAAYIAKRRKR